MQSLVIAALVFALFIAIFASQNYVPVEINFLFWSREMPLVIVFLVAALLGAIIIGLPGWVKQFQQNILVRSLKNRVKSLEQERDDLQALLTEKSEIPKDEPQTEPQPEEEPEEESDDQEV